MYMPKIVGNWAIFSEIILFSSHLFCILYWHTEHIINKTCIFKQTIFLCTKWMVKQKFLNASLNLSEDINHFTSNILLLQITNDKLIFPNTGLRTWSTHFHYINILFLFLYTSVKTEKFQTLT